MGPTADCCREHTHTHMHAHTPHTTHMPPTPPTHLLLLIHTLTHYTYTPTRPCTLTCMYAQMHVHTHTHTAHLLLLTYPGTGSAGPARAMVLRGFQPEGLEVKGTNTCTYTVTNSCTSGKLTIVNDLYFPVNCRVHKPQHHQACAYSGPF